MGTGRDSGRPAKIDRAATALRKHQHRQAAVTPSRVDALPGNPNHDRKKKHKLRVRPMMPKAGMIYFRDRYLLMRERRDRALGVALRKAFHYVSKQLLNERFARMFEAATEVQQQQIKQRGDPKPHTALDSNTFFSSLPRHDAVQPWAQHISKSLLTSLFMILRSARLNWHQTPRRPFDISQHSLLSKAIDGFNAADRLSWSTDAPFLRWMIRGGPGFHVKNTARMADHSMDLESNDEKDIGNSKGRRDNNSTNRLMNPVPTGEAMEGIITHDDNIFQLTYEQVVESMRVLSIEVDVPSLVEAFGRHNLNDDGDQATGSPNGEQCPFDDDLDVDMVL
ncbi:hypothetical protein B0I37DRAFT_410787 [Chaetomium sp. MPI-CAGE-AT-0009]|nr:hypothetical protein B0I37DRAFT_410787 [Chaetomium sp. MPI-CAGE-AT-0009]